MMMMMMMMMMMLNLPTRKSDPKYWGPWLPHPFVFPGTATLDQPGWVILQPPGRFVVVFHTWYRRKPFLVPQKNSQNQANFDTSGCAGAARTGPDAQSLTSGNSGYFRAKESDVASYIEDPYGEHLLIFFFGIIKRRLYGWRHL